MSEQRARLIKGLWSTDKAVREIVELGPPAVDDLDAIAADSTQAREVRLAASRVAHEIRDRAMRAPPAPPAPSNTRAQLGDGFHARYDVDGFVARLIAAGAVRVVIERETLIAGLPNAPDARARLFAIYNVEVDELGEEFGGEEVTGHAMTAEEAAACGAEPSEWVVDDFHARDTGQAHLRFWWD